MHAPCELVRRGWERNLAEQTFSLRSPDAEAPHSYHHTIVSTTLSVSFCLSYSI